MILPNSPDLHALATKVMGKTDAHDHSVEIDGPRKGSYTSYRVTKAGKDLVLAAAGNPTGQIVLPL